MSLSSIIAVASFFYVMILFHFMHKIQMWAIDTEEKNLIHVQVVGGLIAISGFYFFCHGVYNLVDQISFSLHLISEGRGTEIADGLHPGYSKQMRSLYACCVFSGVVVFMLSIAVLGPDCSTWFRIPWLKRKAGQR